MKKLVKSVAIACIFSFFVTGCGILPKEEEFHEAPVVKEFEGANYGKTEVRRGDLVDAKEIAAIYKGTSVRNIHHSENSKVQKVYVKKGDKVRTGDILIRYEIGGSQKQIDESEQKIKVKETQLRQQRELLKLELEKQKAVNGSASAVRNIREQYAASMKQYQTELKILKLEKQEAQEDVASYDLLAEIDGMITYVASNMEGQIASTEEPAVTITGNAKNRFEANTKYADKFKDGDKVQIDVSGVKYEMQVEKPAGGSKLYFYPTNKKVEFENGTRGEAEYIISQKKDVLYLPSATVYKMGEQTIVYVEDENGMKQIREIETGIEVDHLTEIVSGLSEGEQVITN